MTRLGAFCALLLAGAALLLPARAEDISQRAAFLGEGTWATEDDCKALRESEAGVENDERMPPRLLTASGARLGEQSCNYAIVRRAGTGHLVEWDCRSGCESFTERVTFTPLPKGDFSVVFAEDGRVQRLVRCEPAKSIPTN